LPFTFTPFYLTWVLAAAALQLYNPSRAGDWTQLWRVPLAAAIAALPAAALRSFWLGTPLVPIFVLVMGLAIAMGLLISRSLYILSFGRLWRQHG
jgi:Na+/H+ antiporter NhaA